MSDVPGLRTKNHGYIYLSISIWELDLHPSRGHVPTTIIFDSSNDAQTLMFRIYNTSTNIGMCYINSPGRFQFLIAIYIPSSRRLEWRFRYHSSSVRFWCHSYVSNVNGRVRDDVWIGGIVLLFGIYFYKAMARAQWVMYCRIHQRHVSGPRQTSYCICRTVILADVSASISILYTSVWFIFSEFCYVHSYSVWVFARRDFMDGFNTTNNFTSLPVIWSYIHSPLYNQWPMRQLIHTNKHNPINS